MSVRVLTWTFHLRLDDMAAKSALHALADHADEDGHSWPSIARVALYMGCHPKTARRALHRLIDMGIVTRMARAGVTDEYSINFDWTPPTEGPTQEGTHPGRVVPSQSLNSPPSSPELPPNEGVTPPQRGSRTVRTVKRTVNEPSIDLRARLPGDWRPNPDDRAYAIDKGLDPESTAAAFTDYFCEGRGRAEKRTAAGWPKRWRVWCSTDADRRGQRPAQFESASDKRAREIKEAIERSKLQ